MRASAGQVVALMTSAQILCTRKDKLKSKIFQYDFFFSLHLTV